MRAALVLSPHLDDAVLGAGQFLAGRPDSIVATAFAGYPDDPELLTPYDSTCGFKTSRDAISGRRTEDQEALALLGAGHIYLDFLDAQYSTERPSAELAAAIVQVVGEHDPEFVVGPLGLLHPDHKLVREALLDAAQQFDSPVWLYEDLPHRVNEPQAVYEALDALRDHGYVPRLGFIGTGPAGSKMSALWCYRSQMGLPEFQNIHSLLVPERFWQVRGGDGQ
jgi:LmbE family N-acetylglucosaminyl deacetylase